MIKVNPSTSSCARRIDEAFQHYGLELIHFDVVFQDGNDQQYRYASDENSIASIEQNDGQSVFSLLSTSSQTVQSFNASGNMISQQSLDEGQVIADLQNALAQDHVTLLSANIVSEGADGEPCSITFPFCEGGYCPS